jgi:UPF0176 protein
MVKRQCLHRVPAREVTPDMAVCTFYKFVRLHALSELQASVQRAGEALDLRGTVLLADEGINGTLTGALEALHSFVGDLQLNPAFAGLPVKFSTAATDNEVFHRLKVRIKREIVALGLPSVDPSLRTGEHVSAARWNQLLDDPSVLVIDTRNRYECAVGSFPGAVQPDTRSFREFPAFVEAQLDPARHRAVAMFCTGGIRCEKASAYMLDQGFEHVYQLEGGILKYFETVEPGANRWQGECFVFDQRVSVNDALTEGEFVQCFACRRPLSAADQQHPDYEVGVCCPHCMGERLESDRAGFRERQRQMILAERRGQKHIGASMQRRAQ